MLQFKSVADLNQLQPNDPRYEVAKQQVMYLVAPFDNEDKPYDPESEGWVVLIERSDIDRILTEIWDDWRLVDVMWEGAYKEGNFIIAIFLANDSFGISFIIPDEDWIPSDLRNILNEILDY